jgi:hypothetical protein
MGDGGPRAAAFPGALAVAGFGKFGTQCDEFSEVELDRLTFGKGSQCCCDFECVLIAFGRVFGH